jgi:3-methyladenine DNA glycosylase AlkC
MNDDRALKHQLGSAWVKRLADSLALAHPTFDKKSFLSLLPRLNPLEMKDRVRLLRDELKKRLPSSYPSALKILRHSARVGSLEGFELWPYTEFVQTYGLEDVALSLDALREFTQAFTSEWAVRPFIQNHPIETMAFLENCARHKNVHVRRWASEGSRPRLPWGERLHEFVRDPSPTLAILETLKFDPELFVRKSVANHLNDIAKDHPHLVLKTLSAWKKAAGKNHQSKIDWIIKRSLRNLIKEGHAGALALIGVSSKPKISFHALKIARQKIRLGERMDFTFVVKSHAKKSQRLVIDYRVHFVKANGRLSPKVFKLKTVELAAHEQRKISKSHLFKPITTREYYAGEHQLEIQINGKIMGASRWELIV